MAHVTPVRPNIPLLVSGIVALALAVLMPVALMDFGHPDMTFAFWSILMVLIGIYGIVGTILGLATLIPGIPR